MKSLIQLGVGKHQDGSVRKNIPMITLILIGAKEIEAFRDLAEHMMEVNFESDKENPQGIEPLDRFMYALKTTADKYGEAKQEWKKMKLKLEEKINHSTQKGGNMEGQPVAPAKKKAVKKVAKKATKKTAKKASKAKK